MSGKINYDSDMTNIKALLLVPYLSMNVYWIMVTRSVQSNLNCAKMDELYLTAT